MLFSKLRMLLVAVIAIATLSTGVGVLARQSTAPQPRGEQDSDQTGSKTEDATQTREAVRTPLADSDDDPSQGDDHESEKTISLQLDIQLLTNEINTIQQHIVMASSNLVQMEISPQNFGGPGEHGGGLVPGLNEEKKLALIRETMTRSRESLDKLRDRYLEKSKELRQKQRELETLSDHPIDSAKPPRQPRPGPIARRAPSPGKSKVAPTVEERLSKIERKLDEVMELLKESKR